MSQPAKIESVNDAIEGVHFCGFEKGQMIFRGQANYHWGINPSLFRIAESIQHAKLYETTTIGPRLFMQIKFPYLHSYDPIEHLMIAQHYGIPTRLLDWSYDVLVALFFACYDPNYKYKGIDGKLFLLESGYFKTFLINSSDQKIYKEPIDINQPESHAQRLAINDIYIVNPVIRNPRMRVQEGCFLFFPWQFNVNDTELMTFQKYIQEQRRFAKEQNKDCEEWYPIFLVEKRVEHEAKDAILKELDEKYGISEKTILIDSKYTKETESLYLKLKEHVEMKSRELVEIVAKG